MADEPRSKKLKNSLEYNERKRLIIVLENAQLETAKIGKNYELLSSDKHASFLMKQNRDPSNYRPDIVHQCLLMLLDSPLNRANLLQVYVHTAKNVLIEINPQTRIPLQLLHKLSIRSADGPQKLLKIIKNPVQDHLPIGCRKYLTSFNAESLIDVREIVPTDEPVVIVIGAMAKGKVNVDYCEKDIKLSSYPLSAALACTKVCDKFEQVWGII